MMENIKKYTEKYFIRYKKVIEQYYPTHGNRGFAEQNMTIQFASTIEDAGDDVFTWYEAPVPKREGENRSGRMDAVIFDQTGSNIFLVESKNIYTTTEIKKVGRDINRICDPKVCETVKKSLIITPSPDFTFYGVVLASVWLNGNQERDKIYKSWINENFLNEYKKELSIDPKKTPVEHCMPIYDNIAYTAIQPAHQHKDCEHKFCHALLALVFEVCKGK